jgi:hypothetical protein
MNENSSSWLIWVAVAVGFVLLLGIGVAIGNSADNTGDTVRASSWADDVCGTVGAWEGQLEAIGDSVNLSNVGARRSDGASGDSVEGTIYVRQAVDRAIQATNDTLQEGLRRAGIPEGNGGVQASAALLDWAQVTENALIAAETSMRDKPNTTSAAFASLGTAVKALESSAVLGRAAFVTAAATDPAIADALTGSRNCSKLMEDQP